MTGTVGQLEPVAVFELKAAGGDRAGVFIGRYPANGAISVYLRGVDTGEPLGKLSTLISGSEFLGPGEFHAKVGFENAFISQDLLECGLFERTDRVDRAGHTEAQVWRIKDPAHIPPPLAEQPARPRARG